MSGRGHSSYWAVIAWAATFALAVGLFLGRWMDPMVKQMLITYQTLIAGLIAASAALFAAAIAYKAVMRQIAANRETETRRENRRHAVEIFQAQRPLWILAITMNNWIREAKRNIAKGLCPSSEPPKPTPFGELKEKNPSAILWPRPAEKLFNSIDAQIWLMSQTAENVAAMNLTDAVDVNVFEKGFIKVQIQSYLLDQYREKLLDCDEQNPSLERLSNERIEMIVAWHGMACKPDIVGEINRIYLETIKP